MSKKQLFDSQSTFKLSRSKIEMFTNCPRCFYLDRKLGISAPPMFPYTLNSAVDALFKKEFDVYRKKHKVPPIVKSAGLNFTPFDSPLLQSWISLPNGLQYKMPKLDIIVHGILDDVWVSPKGEFAVVDYKSTSTEKPISLDDIYKAGYKRQVEVYQWLLRKNGYKTSDTAYFVYANAQRKANMFWNKLIFKTTLIPYEGNDRWVENTVHKIYECLNSNTIPAKTETCKVCE
jgi:hypothetical protein